MMRALPVFKVVVLPVLLALGVAIEGAGGVASEDPQHAQPVPAAGPHATKALQLRAGFCQNSRGQCPVSHFSDHKRLAGNDASGSLPDYARQEEGSDIQQFMNVRDGATSIRQGADTAMRRPEEISRWFSQTSDAVLAEISAVERAAAGRATSNEFKSTLTDARPATVRTTGVSGTPRRHHRGSSRA